MSCHDYCRTCLSKNKEMRNLNAVILIGGVNVRLSDILQRNYDYKVPPEDNFSKYICINCVHQLTLTYSFKLLINSTYLKLSETCNLLYANDYNDNNYVSEDDQKHTPNKIKLPITYEKTKIIRKINRKTNYRSILLYCVECKSEFESAKKLNDHCKNNHPVKSVTGRDCDYCNEKFDDFRSLVLHRKLHLKPYLCENCWEGFLDIDEQKTHSCQPNQRDKNKECKRVLRQCDQCGKSYPPGYIKIHMLTHSNNRSYCCKFCPKKFKVPGSLHSHILWNHKRTRNHKCEVCNATFISSSSRSSHIRKNHLKEKKYGCDSCGKRFFSKSELQRHSLTHTGVKNFHCHLCDKSYQTRYGLNVHLKSHSQLHHNMNILGL